MVEFSYTSKSIEEIFSLLKTSGQGLSSTEAKERLQKNGSNDIESVKNFWWLILLRQIKSPFVYLLFAAAVLSFLLKETVDAVMVLSFIVVNTALGFYQEFKSEKSLQMLKQFINSSAKVLRDGKKMLISSKDLVVGDIVLLETGDKIPADVRFLETKNLMVDESSLTGESVAVRKVFRSMPKPAQEIYEAKNLGFSTCGILDGEAKAVVVAVGKNTAVGNVAKLVVETEHVSNFEKGIFQFSKFILRMVFITLLCVVAANVIFKHDSLNFAELIIFAVALAVSVIPEALPVVTTFSLSRGALHLARHKVVVKRLSAIEDLGGMEILCTDKTGTITENLLAVADISPKADKNLVRYANIATSTAVEKRLDPFDVALWDCLAKSERDMVENTKRLADVPFHPAKRRNLVLTENAGQKILIMRGAPEVVLEACQKTSISDKKELSIWLKNEGLKGRRVLAVAKKKVKISTENAEDIKLEKEAEDMEFLGVISFVDPIKKSAPATLRRAEQLGVQIKILTGDGKEVAGAVAMEIGLITSEDEVITGEALARMSPEEQTAAIEKYHVFARVSPEEKYDIIEHLQKKYQVGFLGEGINDAPALKIAGVSMVVQGASDIARESADIVLLQKSLSVILDGVREGRAVFANTTKYIKSTLASNFGNFYAVALASLVIDYLPMLSIQILLLNLLSDFPMIAVSTDSVDEIETSRPRKYQVRDITMIAVFLGVVSTVFDFIFFGIFRHGEPSLLQTSWFMGSILTELAFVFSIRSRLPFFRAKFPSWPLLSLSVMAAVFTVYLPFTEFGQKVFFFREPKIIEVAVIVGVVAVYFMVTETVKLLYYRFSNKNVVC